MFGPYNFEKMNETDIRENIIAPLLRELGYRHGASNDIMTEQTLRYPKRYIGKKKKGKDQDIRGKADYILEVDRRLRWVIEAKAPEREISIDDIEQAYTYAYHPEIRAIYFMVTNGKEFRLYRTINGPDASAIFLTNYSELENNYQGLSNLLSPQSLQRDYQDFVLDTGKPLAPGLRSFAKLINGKISYTDNSLNHPLLKGMNIFISEGAIQRMENGGMVAYLKTESPFQQFQELNRLLGLETFDVFTDSEFISSDSGNPTIFSSDLNYTIPKGTRLYDFTRGNYNISPIDITVKTKTVASGIFNDNKFFGKFTVNFTMSGFPTPINMNGNFKIRIG